MRFESTQALLYMHTHACSTRIWDLLFTSTRNLIYMQGWQQLYRSLHRVDGCACMGGGLGRGKPGLGMHGGWQERQGDDLPDNRKLYVAGLSENLTDSTLRSYSNPTAMSCMLPVCPCDADLRCIHTVNCVDCLHRQERVAQ